MKFAIVAALFATVSAAGTCPDTVVAQNFGTDNTCDAGSKDDAKTTALQENWDFLAKTFGEACYKVGDKYIKWTCDDTTIKAQVFTDAACESQDTVATDHPVEKTFEWG